jgi:hypothetical protein
MPIKTTFRGGGEDRWSGKFGPGFDTFRDGKGATEPNPELGPSPQQMDPRPLHMRSNEFLGMETNWDQRNLNTKNKINRLQPPATSDKSLYKKRKQDDDYDTPY